MIESLEKDFYVTLRMFKILFIFIWTRM